MNTGIFNLKERGNKMSKYFKENQTEKIALSKYLKKKTLNLKGIRLMMMKIKG